MFVPAGDIICSTLSVDVDELAIDLEEKIVIPSSHHVRDSARPTTRTGSKIPSSRMSLSRHPSVSLEDLFPTTTRSVSIFHSLLFLYKVRAMCSVTERSLLRLFTVTPPDVFRFLGHVFHRSKFRIPSNIIVAPDTFTHAIAERLTMSPATGAVEIRSSFLHPIFERDFLIDASDRCALQGILVDKTWPLQGQSQLFFVRLW